ncbi:VapE domain-containing protein [Nostoc sp. NIES-2111]
MNTQSSTSTESHKALCGPFSRFTRVKDTAPSGQLTLPEFIGLVRNPEGWGGTFDTLRNGAAPADKAKIKQGLPAAALSGLFEGGRKKTNLHAHSGLLQVDFDGVPAEAIPDLADTLRQDRHTLAGFLSPTGTGYKAVVRIEADGNTHEQSARAAFAYYKTLTGHEPDKACKDVSRLCYLSSDPEAWLKDTATVLPVEAAQAAVDRGQDCLAWCAYQVAQRKGGYTEGNRNAFVNALAVMAKKYGVPEGETLDFVGSLSDGDRSQDAENAQVVRSVYQNGGLPFGSASYTLPRNAARPKAPAKGKPTTAEQDPSKLGGEKPQPAFVQAINYLTGRYQFRRNTILKVAEIAPLGTADWKEVNESDLLTELWDVGFTLAEAKLLHWLKSSKVEPYNPILTYFESLPPWTEAEGDRIEGLLSYLVLQDENGHRSRLNTQGKKWLVRAVATALRPGEVNKQILTLQGEGQNFGKTTFARFLCPPALKDYYTENITFDKDGEIVFTQNLLGNLDELPQLKADMERLKQATSKDRVKVRAPYEKKPVEADRIISLIATTNKAEFLEDPTGSVRWLIFDLASIRHAGGREGGYTHDVDINRVWAQAYTLYKAGFAYHMTQAEQMENEAANRTKTRQTHEYQLIAEYLCPPAGKVGEFVHYWQASKVLEFLKWAVPSLQGAVSAERIGTALVQHGYTKKGVRLNGNNNPVKCYEIGDNPRIQSFLAGLPTTPTTNPEYDTQPF